MIYILSIGSNMGDRIENINKSLKLLSNLGEILKQSSYYETEPHGPDQNKFINIAIEYSAVLKPEILLEELKQIEKKLGRKKTLHWGPRVIDIDIIFVNQKFENTAELIIPHKEFKKRKFVLIPLDEIFPSLIIDKKPVNYWLGNCKDKSQVQLIHSESKHG